MKPNSKPYLFLHILNNVFTLLLISVPVFGATPTTTQSKAQSTAIHIESNSAEMNSNTGIATYLGNVIVTHDHMSLKADKVVIYIKKKQVIKIIAIGEKNIARYQGLTNKGTLWQAWGFHIDYNIEKKTMSITKKAKILNGDDLITSDKIDYDFNQNQVKAYGTSKNKTEKNRVKIILKTH